MKKIKYRYLFLGVVLVTILSCKSNFKLKWTNEKAPEYFTAKFETTKGDFVIESRREWSPAAVDRLYQLIEHGFYTDIAIFRVLPNFVAQFGIHNDSTISSSWNRVKIKDEPVLKPNTQGSVSFARGGPESRKTQLFINLKDNSPRLDTISFMDVTGFPVVAQVISGFDVAESFYDGYEAELDDKQDKIFAQGNTYLKKNYPKLDYIHKAYITKEE
ncbi:peptidylprolyl isomerase [Flagellimonas zhangzhouensis]|uniref:peptidylprolyl isomerase n=1 Tax=Flagellimonas zhangzhouensis TaxID=1073328 RepID=A0A1H2SDR9_9FLAO|nr:peptidylprolyl isomerase [Allomuricauda zhangzhouensis]SDQ73685.1 Peptidyl-prolyl cis-trans isomerase (rotamase)-cyclophilin family [Allomuricauda zhangzhouensis]SDW29781.1 Peptidyl-prolyl cis-trans isomerase (rotamase)-cyclophilin family [Allomuricauda zhangzhouensis]